MTRIRRNVVITLVVAALAVGALGAWAAGAGYRLYIVHTGSMVPVLRSGDLVIDRPAPAQLRRGQIVTFRDGSGPDAVITHRVAAVRGDRIRTKGDANPTADPWVIPRSDVVGTPLTVLPGAGYVLYYLRQPAGVASLVTTVLAVWLLWGVFFGARPPVREPAAT